MKNVHGFSYFKDMAKFWSVLLEHFIKHQPLVSAECCLCTTTKFWCCHKEGVDAYGFDYASSPMKTEQFLNLLWWISCKTVARLECATCERIR